VQSAPTATYPGGVKAKFAELFERLACTRCLAVYHDERASGNGGPNGVNRP
jgi:hypothetical protein